MTFSPDGQRVAACDIADDGSPGIAVYDASSGIKRWSRSQDATPRAPDAAIDPNNPVGSLIGRALAEGLAMAILSPVFARLAGAHFSPDSRLVAHAGMVLDAGTGAGAVALPIEPPTSALTLPMTPAFSRDSLWMAARTADGVTVLDTRTGQAHWSAACPGKPVWACFTGDNQLVVVCDPAFEMVRFDAATGQQVSRHPIDSTITFRLLFVDPLPAVYSATADGGAILAVGGAIFSSETTFTVYDASDATARFAAVTLEREQSGDVGEGRGVLSPAGNRIAVDRPRLTVINARSGSTDWQEHHAVADVAYNPNGSRLAALVGGELRVYDTGLSAPTASAGGPVQSVSVTGGALPLLATGSPSEDGHGVASLFLATQGKLVLEKRDRGLVRAALLSPDGHQLATGRSSGVAAVYDTVSGSRQFWITHDDAVNDLTFDQAGGLLGTASNDKTARLIDTTTHTERWRKSHPQSVRFVEIDPLGHWMATACADQTTRILETEHGAITAAFPHEGQVRALAVARTRALVAAAYEGGAVLVIDPASGEQIGQADHLRRVNAAALSATGDLLASGGLDNTVKISGVTTSAVTLNLSVPTDSEVVQLLFSPVDSLLAVATSDGIVLVLDPSTGDTIARLSHPGPVTGVTFSSDGSLLAVGCEDTLAYVYPTTWS